MYGSGHRIVGMETTLAHRQTAVHGRVEIAPSGFCAAVLGTTVHDICVLRAAMGSPQRAEIAEAVFVLPRHFLESCHPKASTLLSQVLGAISQ